MSNSPIPTPTLPPRWFLLFEIPLLQDEPVLVGPFDSVLESVYHFNRCAARGDDTAETFKAILLEGSGPFNTLLAYGADVITPDEDANVTSEQKSKLSLKDYCDFPVIPPANPMTVTKDDRMNALRWAETNLPNTQWGSEMLDSKAAEFARERCKPVPAQEISAEERAREIISACHGWANTENVERVEKLLTAHAAQEVARMREAYKIGLTGKHEERNYDGSQPCPLCEGSGTL